MAVSKLTQEQREYYKSNPNACLHCGKDILPRPDESPAEIKRRKFCNRSCSAKHNNVKYNKGGKMKKSRICEKCGEKFHGPYRAKMVCQQCRRSHLHRDSKDLIKGNCTSSMIRSHARLAINGQEKICKICGYSKFVEVCHILPVSKFHKSAKIIEINDPSNLMYLCPNCHWEYDHAAK